MYRLLIVDDEPVIVEGLYHLFQQVTDMELDIITAYSGNEALDWLNRTRIDIVLSDIQMPGLNGIQLMEEIQQRWPACRVVMFTGYSDFEYVYRSIRHEGVRYLLKSEGDDVVLDTVRKMVAEIKDKLKAEQWTELIENQMRNELPLLQKEFILDVLYDPATAEELTNGQLERLNISLSSDRHVIPLIARLDPSDNPITMDEQTRQLYALKQALERCLEERFRFVAISLKHTFWYVIVQPIELTPVSDAALYVREALAVAQRICSESFELSVSFVHSANEVSWKGLGRAFPYMNGLLDYRIGQEKEVILSEPLEQADVSKGLSVERLKLVEGYLMSGNDKGFVAFVEEWIGNEESFGGRATQAYAENYYTLIVYLLQSFQRWGLTEKLSTIIDLRALLRLDGYRSYEDMLGLFRRLGESVVRLRKDEEADQLERPIRFLQTYMKAHLAQDLSLVKLAELVHFNPSYLSRLFKRVTEENLSDYINRMRIERAIELLLNPDMKVQHAAMSVGFVSVSYFNRVFKKLVGSTPQAYRDAHQSKSI
ncbi:response regulator transcription factor [Paenibacillus sp. YIM B09110]|uniref:response regulator transcription factor n=1 Tax=Paenibacillus sp. YIM B09110 TaxID=3126102 RepID=UPI00301CA99D